MGDNLMLLLGEPGAKEFFRKTFEQNPPWDEGQIRFVFHYIYDVVNEFIDSDGDDEVIDDACGSVGEFAHSVDRIVSWCFEREPRIDALPFWEAWLLLDYHLDGDESISVKDISRAFDRAVVVIRQFEPLYRRPKKETPELPVVRLEPPEIELGSKIYPVTANQAMAFDAMVKAHPQPVGLTAVIGYHPERSIDKLPQALKSIVNTNSKGSRLTL